MQNTQDKFIKLFISYKFFNINVSWLLLFKKKNKHIISKKNKFQKKNDCL